MWQTFGMRDCREKLEAGMRVQDSPPLPPLALRFHPLYIKNLVDVLKR